ncbi:MarR family transcriptional regulator [Nocardia sp. NBC_01730]|uniref:MarR family winged helix-turn-helix transcriptional regulator n=1 Tax=Nocardia sp. NBC_01730 TaxID=2975998 RepID=UPI002E0E2DE6|nr:MarR family transcriptional regulator [Nocardia sp. NBC_01730]
MDKPTDQVEFEAMLLGRYTINPHYPQETGLLERSAYLLLSRLGMEGPMSIGQLCDAFGLNSSTINRQTTTLLRAGLVERIPDPDGGMARKFRITTKGRRRFDTERATKVTGLDDIMRDWTPEDVAAFAGYLRRFNRDIEHRRGQPWPRPEPVRPGHASS